MSEIGNIEEWFRNAFGKGVTEVKDDLEDLKARALSLENNVAQHAQIALAAAQREVALAQALAPSLGEKAQEIVAAAEKGLAVVEAYVQDVTGHGPSGM